MIPSDLLHDFSEGWPVNHQPAKYDVSLRKGVGLDPVMNKTSLWLRLTQPWKMVHL